MSLRLESMGCTEIRFEKIRYFFKNFEKVLKFYGDSSIIRPACVAG